MSCPLFLSVGVLAVVAASTSGDFQASLGVVLLQKSSVHTYVEADLDSTSPSSQHGVILSRKHLPFEEGDSEKVAAKVAAVTTPIQEVPDQLPFRTSLTEFYSGHAFEDTGLSLDLGEQRALNNMLIGGEWSRWTPHAHAHKHPQGVYAFLSSVVLFDWCLFASAIMIFFILHTLVLGQLSANGQHALVLLIWLAVAAVYNTVIWARFGTNAGVSWFAGYLLEMIFLVENIFIFHIVIQAFKTPLTMTPKALHFVVWGQILFEMIFFMGLAAWLRSFKVLPYLLGIWLICCGFLAAYGQPYQEVEIMETKACRYMVFCMGDRLSPTYEKDGGCLFRDSSSGKMRVSLLGLVVLVLLLADFLLEIDVVLTKIEELPNHYIAFTSSALAAFTIPDLFFVAKGLLQRFVLLKYGIGFVLVLFGAQMLLSSVYVIRPVVASLMIIAVLGSCMLASALYSCCCKPCNSDASISTSTSSPSHGRSDES